MGLRLSVTALGRYVVIAASGELDGAAAPALAVIPKTVCNPDKGSACTQALVSRHG